MSISSITFCAGLALIIIAIIGGGIEVKEIKIPSLGLIPRILSFAGGIALLALGVLDPQALRNSTLLSGDSKKQTATEGRADSLLPQGGGLKVIAYSGLGIVTNPENAKYKVRIFYRSGRREDAARVVGAMLQAGYGSDAVESDLNEVIAIDRGPNAALIKTSDTARSIADELARITRLAIPLWRVSVAPEEIRSVDAEVIMF
jgi:hypothetical protein